MAAAALGAATAAREVAAAELAGLAVVAPFDGVVLQVNAKAGEYAAAGGSAEPLVVLGAAPPLQVRIDIDEADIARLDATSPGEVRSRGVPAQRWPITPVRVEPLVVPKRSLSNRADERVDTRVLQVVYALPADATDVFPGQLVDAYLPARPQ
jgi:HlyD family secretion protein